MSFPSAVIGERIEDAKSWLLAVVAGRNVSFLGAGTPFQGSA